MNFQKKVLENGLRIIAIPIPLATSVTVMSLIEAGSKYENKNNNGISHFLEHMCFKGTNKRPKAIDIAKEFDGLGAVNNAFTGHECTGYWGKSHPAHFEKILDLIADLYLNPVFPPEELEREKGVIIEEINMDEDIPLAKVQETYQELLYKNTPAGLPIVGSKENVRLFKREDFIDYRNKNYVASATTIVIAGQIDENTVFDKVEKVFANISVGSKLDKEKTIVLQSEPRVISKYKDIEQTHIRIGVRAYDTYDKRNTSLELMTAIIGNGMSSRLFQKMREELGICYYVGANFLEQTDVGSFAVSAGVDSSRVEEGIKGILDEMKRIRDEKVPEEELRKAKDYAIGHLYLGLESSDSLADFYGFQEIFHKKIKTPKEIEEEIEKVTANDIQNVARDIMKNEGLNLAVVGKYREEDNDKFKKILSL